mmetsp:Transcript_23428/g.93011  ORF Transcript_23428/g.93011 Transcript_23428/m.93011 type:complete len:116 (-) Transcript_23428:1252-1599(-)
MWRGTINELIFPKFRPSRTVKRRFCGSQLEFGESKRVCPGDLKLILMPSARFMREDHIFLLLSMHSAVSDFQKAIKWILLRVVGNLKHIAVSFCTEDFLDHDRGFVDAHSESGPG